MQEKQLIQGNLIHFNVQSTLDTIRDLNFIRVCGSECERRGMDILARRLDEIGLDRHFHTFRDKWLEPYDPHLLVCGRRIMVKPAMELSFGQGVECVNIRVELATIDNCTDKIAVMESFNREKTVVHDAAAQLIAYPFEPEMEAYLWEQQDWDMKRVPTAIVAPSDISFVLGALGEPAELKWSVNVVEREFRNLVAEIPGTERPDQIVVMGAHIDSWPGTVGASDDAAGCAILIEAAKWFTKHLPARTVRLIWFTGEELDARGSRKYMDDCIENPGAVKLMVCVDSGCELNTGGFNSYTSDEPTIEWARQRLNLDGMNNFIAKTPGTDARAFIEHGIPVFAVEAPSKQSAHLPDDDPDHIDLQKLQTLGSLSIQAAIYAANE